MGRWVEEQTALAAMSAGSHPCSSATLNTVGDVSSRVSENQLKTLTTR